MLIATDAIAASVIKRLNIGGEDDTLGVLLPLKGQPGGYWEPAVWEWFETQRELITDHAPKVSMSSDEAPSTAAD